MEDQKMLDMDHISWYEEDHARLDYQTASQKDDKKDDHAEKENSSSTSETSDNNDEEQVDIRALLRKNDIKWKKRLQKARDAAYAKGLEEGNKAGYEQAHQEIDEKLGRLETIVDQAHQEWLERKQALNPGLLDLVFDLVEKIGGLPVENPQIREQLEEELSHLLHETEDHENPVLWISDNDYAYVEDLVEKYAPKFTIQIRISEALNSGEFEFETDKETVIYRFRKMLDDFRKNLSLPSWR